MRCLIIILLMRLDTNSLIDNSLITWQHLSSSNTTSSNTTSLKSEIKSARPEPQPSGSRVGLPSPGNRNPHRNPLSRDCGALRLSGPLGKLFSTNLVRPREGGKSGTAAADPRGKHPHDQGSRVHKCGDLTCTPGGNHTLKIECVWVKPRFVANWAHACSAALCRLACPSLWPHGLTSPYECIQGT